MSFNLTQHEADKLVDGSATSAVIPTPNGPAMNANRGVVEKPAKPGRHKDGAPKVKDPAKIAAAKPVKVPSQAAVKPQAAQPAAAGLAKAKAAIAAKMPK